MAVEDFKVYTQDSGWVSLAQTLPQGTSEGQLLHWDGTQWAAASDGTADGQYLIWDDTAKRWEPGTHETGNLPIQSDDGTVVLDSPVQRLFSISNGTPGSYGLVFNTGTGHFAAGIKGSYTPGAATVTFRNLLENNATNTTILRLDSPVFGNSGAAVTKFGSTCYPDNRGDNVSFIGYEFGTFYEASLYPSDPSKEFVDATGYRASDSFRNATGKVVGFLSQVSSDGDSKNTETYQFYAEGLAPSRFNGEVQTSTVKGVVGTDAQIGFSSVINFQFMNADSSFGSKINVGYNEASGSGFAAVGVGGCYFYCRDSKRLGIGATGINFNADAAADATTYHWTMEPDGSLVGNSGSVVKTGRVTGRADTDAQIKLGSQAELKNGDDSEYAPLTNDSIPTKKYVDELIWIGSQAEYDALGIYDNKRLYCITD